jgi:hypothetical protein
MSSFGKDLSVDKLNGWKPLLNENFKTGAVTGSDGATPSFTIPAGTATAPMLMNWYFELNPNASPIASQTFTITLPAGFVAENFLFQVDHNMETINATGVLLEVAINGTSAPNTCIIRRLVQTGTIGVKSYLYLRIIPLAPVN